MPSLGWAAMRRLTVLGLALLTTLAGCLTLPEEQDAAALEPPASGPATMTATESRRTDNGLCGGLGLGGGRFCATLTVSVEGTISGLAALPVSLDTFNGPVSITESKPGAWGFEAVLTAQGATAAEAASRLELITLEWAHERGGEHFLEVAASTERGEDLSASIALRVPRAVLLELAAETSNGPVEAKGIRASGLALGTSNGAIRVDAEAAQVSLDTSNGAIDAKITPIADGRWVLDTSNGAISLVVPEGPRYGYSIEGDTSNGEVEYGLRDGEMGPCPEGSQYYTPPCSERSFETHRYGSRDLRVQVRLDTSNGGIRVDPA